MNIWIVTDALFSVRLIFHGARLPSLLTGKDLEGKGGARANTREAREEEEEGKGV